MNTESGDILSTLSDDGNTTPFPFPLFRIEIGNGGTSSFTRLFRLILNLSFHELAERERAGVV